MSKVEPSQVIAAIVRFAKDFKNPYSILAKAAPVGSAGLSAIAPFSPPWPSPVIVSVVVGAFGVLIFTFAFALRRYQVPLLGIIAVVLMAVASFAVSLVTYFCLWSEFVRTLSDQDSQAFVIGYTLNDSEELKDWIADHPTELSPERRLRKLRSTRKGFGQSGALQ